jgi:flagellar basal-body rod modification protein FlgD
MSNVTSVTGAPGAPTTQPATSGVLGKDDFLELLTAQLRYQNPLNPMEDAEFIGQMAQFTSVEQLSNVAAAMERLSFSSQMTESVALIGRTVTWEKDGQPASGVVSAVSVDDGAIHLTVGADVIEPAQVQRVE